MAKRKKSTVNKAEEIRNYYKSNPSAKPSQVQAALKAKGIDVSTQQISTTRLNAIKSGKLKLAGKAASSKAGRPAKSTVSDSTSISIGSLTQAKQLIEEAGGVSNAKAVIDAVAKILS